MYIVINMSINMTKGQICAQVAHIANKITEEIIENLYMLTGVQEDYYRYIEWKKQDRIIIKKGNQNQLDALLENNTSRGTYDYDDKLTAVGFLPGYDMGEMLKHFQLY